MGWDRMGNGIHGPHYPLVVNGVYHVNWGQGNQYMAKEKRFRKVSREIPTLRHQSILKDMKHLPGQWTMQKDALEPGRASLGYSLRPSRGGSGVLSAWSTRSRDRFLAFQSLRKSDTRMTSGSRGGRSGHS